MNRRTGRGDPAPTWRMADCRGVGFLAPAVHDGERWFCRAPDGQVGGTGGGTGRGDPAPTGRMAGCCRGVGLLAPAVRDGER